MNPLEKSLFQIYRAIVQAKPAIIDAMGAAALEFIDDNFAKQGFQGDTFQPWPRLKKRPKGKARKILVDTATLRRSMKQTNHSDHVTISTDVPYAQAHNEGMDIRHPSRSIILSYRGAKGGKLRLAKTRTEAQQRRTKEIRRATVPEHTVRMPQRRFMGPSPVLSNMCEKAVLQVIIARIPS